MYDIREKSILELHEALEKGETTSVELVKAYLARIAKYDSGNLNSVLEINPDALFIAEKCDLMRKEGLAEGVMFGIPVMVKDNIDSCDKMHTTAGSLALMNNVPLSDSGVVEKLRSSGAILMGKTNMTEYANFMTEKMPSGYSSRGGQVINPYHSVLTPSGSSSGSGVATAASFAAACVGTETNGSIISPSKNNCIVGIKPTVGLVSRRGIIPISHTQDTAGPMARSVEDAAILLTAIAGMDENEETTLTIPDSVIGIDYLDFTKKDVKGMRIGYVVDAKLSEYEQASMDLALETLKNCGAELVPVELNYSGKHSRAVMCHEFKAGINAYLMGTSCDMKNLTDIRNYNLAHSKACLKHNQTLLDQCDALSGRLTEREYLEGLLDNLERSRGTIDRVCKEYNVELFIQAHYNSIHAVSGYPCITVPTELPAKTTGRSIFFIGPKWSEGALITAAHAFEQASQKRIAPELFAFEPATLDDVNEILALYISKKGTPFCSWNEYYPTMVDIEADIAENNLFVYKNENGDIIGAVSLENAKSAENPNLAWSTMGKSIAFSRLCVANEYTGRGLGMDILGFAYTVVKERGYSYGRILASKDNDISMHMYTKKRYRATGECEMYGVDFIGFEVDLYNL